jgi:hypothetical protein
LRRQAKQPCKQQHEEHPNHDATKYGSTSKAGSGSSNCAHTCSSSWAKAPIKIARMTLTIKLDGNWSSFQLANSAPPLSVTDSAIAPSARMTTLARVPGQLAIPDGTTHSMHVQLCLGLPLAYYHQHMQEMHSQRISTLCLFERLKPVGTNKKEYTRVL